MKSNRQTDELLSGLVRDLRTHAMLVAAGMDSLEALRLVFGARAAEDARRINTMLNELLEKKDERHNVQGSED